MEIKGRRGGTVPKLGQDSWPSGEGSLLLYSRFISNSGYPTQTKGIIKLLSPRLDSVALRFLPLHPLTNALCILCMCIIYQLKPAVRLDVSQFRPNFKLVFENKIAQNSYSIRTIFDIVYCVWSAVVEELIVLVEIAF